jgi:hypothetical protein
LTSQIGRGATEGEGIEGETLSPQRGWGGSEETPPKDIMQLSGKIVIGEAYERRRIRIEPLGLKDSTPQPFSIPKGISS